MRIGVIGATGRMGTAILRELLAAGDVRLAGAVARQGDASVGRDAAVLVGFEPHGVLVSDDVEALLAAKPDAVIDFTLPEAVLGHADLATRYGVPMVTGTTGFDAGQQARLKYLADRVAILWDSNMSLGVTLLSALVERAAASLGPEFDIEIVEMHHRHKLDAPSGTALSLGLAAARGRGVVLEDVSQVARHGHTGARAEGGIGFAVLRGGDVVGDHSVVFAGAGERVELVHKATDRAIFARGALKAARWLAGRSAGFYGMKDVLGLAQAG